MAETNGKVKKQSEPSEKTLRKMLKFQQIANAAVQKAQEENRLLGIPNWYSINGVIVSDRDLEQNGGKTKRQK